MMECPIEQHMSKERLNRRVLTIMDLSNRKDICPDVNNCLGAKYKEVFQAICDGNYDGCTPQYVNHTIDKIKQK